MAKVSLLASYPKSGNTWVRLFLTCLIGGTAAVQLRGDRTRIGSNLANRHLTDEWLGLDSADLLPSECERLPAAFVDAVAVHSREDAYFKVHHAWLTRAGVPLLDARNIAAVVYIVRDPRDVAVSLAHHLLISVDGAIDAMRNPEMTLTRGWDGGHRCLPQPLSTWSDNVRGWLAADVNRLLVRYEDMIAAPLLEFGRIATFLQQDCSVSAVERAVRAVQFDTLAAQEREIGFDEAPAPEVKFFRRGVAGDWMQVLTPQQVVRIEQDHGAVMRMLGYVSEEPLPS